jgi:hypothetical protein
MSEQNVAPVFMHSKEKRELTVNTSNLHFSAQFFLPSLRSAKSIHHFFFKDSSFIMVLSMKKSVHFALEDTIYKYERLCLSSSGSGATETMCFQPSEYEQMRIEALESVEVAKQRGMSEFLKQNYGCTDSKTQEMLCAWAKCKSTNRGLERFVCEEYGQQRLLHRRKITEAVLCAQANLRKDNRNNASAASIIQTVSSTLSINAIQFARMLAIADHEAVGTSEIPLRIVSTPSVSRTASRPPTGKSPITTRKHRRDETSSSRRPPRHPGPVRYQIRVSPHA